jgi:hypothetical protein
MDIQTLKPIQLQQVQTLHYSKEIISSSYQYLEPSFFYMHSHKHPNQTFIGYAKCYIFILTHSPHIQSHTVSHKQDTHYTPKFSMPS